MRDISSHDSLLSIGLREEDKSVWERRVPLVPEDVGELIRGHGLEVHVEPSAKRAFRDTSYQAAGAILEPGLSDPGVIFGVKEIPIERLLEGKVYVFFAHVIKGQPHNMPLLRRLLELGATLIDYERIADAAGRRLVFFGHEAGQAGMIDSLHVLGQRLAWEGFDTPFAALEPAHAYDDLEAAEAAISQVGERIRRSGIGVADLPVVVGFTGRGNVSRGAWEIFDLLPHEEVEPEELADLVEQHGDIADRLFKVRFDKEHLARPKEPGAAFDEAEYRAHPERYQGGRLVRYLPHLTMLIHGVFWSTDYPRFLTRREASSMWKAGGQKLRVIGDVTCDVGGSIELTYKATQTENPTYVYHPLSDDWSDGFEGEGIVILAVDNLPCELPRAASRNFSRALRGFVSAIAAADYGVPFEDLDLPPEVRRAVIVHRGELAPDYRYLEEALEEFGSG